MGTGGYVLEAFEPGVRSLVKRNKNYWKTGRAHFDTVEILAIKDTTARSNALLSGKIDAYNFVDLKTINLLQKNPQVRILRVAGKAHYVFPMLMDAAPFTDPDVRLAMKYAIDREDVVKRILFGYGSVGNDQPISAAYQFFNSGIPQHSYDPDKAKSLLKKAGHSDLAVQLYVSEVPFAGATDTAVLFREHAAKAGIKIEVVKAPEDGYWSDTWNKKPLCASRWSGRIDTDSMISAAYSADALKAGWNETHMNDPRLEKLMTQARVEFDEAKRQAMFFEMQQIIHDDGGALIHSFADFVDATSDKIGHDKLSADWDMDGGRASERWWFTS
jgi:peptide/nickel transport system substrate-binding protein